MKHLNTKALSSVIEELNKQDQHQDTVTCKDSFAWLAKLSGDVGTVAETSLHRKFGYAMPTGLRMAIVKLAATSLQWLEQIDNDEEPAINNITIPMEKQTLAQKAGAAAFIASMGAENTGVRTKAQLMHPVSVFSDEDSQRESGRLLGTLLSALLKVLPPEDSAQILKDQDELLSFVE